MRAPANGSTYDLNQTGKSVSRLEFESGPDWEQLSYGGLLRLIPVAAGLPSQFRATQAGEAESTEPARCGFPSANI